MLRPWRPGGAPALALALAFAAPAPARAHVPQYDCKHNCCHAKYDIADVDDPDDAISQAFYFTDEGGVEFDKADFNTNPGEGQLVYVDAVFRDEVPRDAYELYIGCGGCASGDQLYDDALKEYEGYGRGKFEPFTQHVYRSYFMDEWRTFNTSKLADCPSKHWTIRLVRNASATSLPRSDKLFWSAVVGRREWFDAVDLLQYPMYVWRNHNHGWSELYSFWWILGLCIVFALLLLFSTDYYNKFDFFRVGIQYQYVKDAKQADVPIPVIVYARDTTFVVRSVCYTLAMLMLVVDFFETLVNGLYSVGQVQPSGESLVWFWLLVMLFGKVMPLLVLSWIWDSMRRHAPEGAMGWARMRCVCKHWCMPVWHPVYAHVNWAWLEILTGISFLFLFGLGFYITPVFIIVAGLVRLGDYRYVTKENLSDTATLLYDERTTLAPATIVEGSFVPPEEPKAEEQKVEGQAVSLGGGLPAVFVRP